VSRGSICRSLGRRAGVLALSVFVLGGRAVSAQNPDAADLPGGEGRAGETRLSAEAIAAGVASPDDYVIGADDVLSIVFWRDKDMSTEVIVRPDGKISLPLINEVMAAGLTPTGLRERITEEAERFLESPQATVVVKQINSRRVYIVGEVGKAGPYPLTTPMTVLQLIATAGGLSDFARREDITIMRTENGIPRTYPFDYESVSRRRKLGQNILLKPGDTVVVP